MKCPFRSVLLTIAMAFACASLHAADLSPSVLRLLEQGKRSGLTDEIIDSLQELVDRNDPAIRTLFKQEAIRIGGSGIQGEAFMRKVFQSVDQHQMKLAERLAAQVAEEMQDGVEAVIRTGSSGDRHMNLSGKANSEGRYDLLVSDDDISFLGPRGEEAARRFNELKDARKLKNARCKGFAMSPIPDATSYDLLVKQIKDPDAFVGAAGFGKIKQEMVEKGGAIILQREGSALKPVAITLADYVQKNGGSTLAEIMDMAQIASDLKRFGPLTMYTSCARQMLHPNLSEREQVKYLLRIYASMQAAGSFGDAAGMGGRQSSYFQEMGEQLMAAYKDKSGNAARALLRRHDLMTLQLDAFESVMLSTCRKVQQMVRQAEREAGKGAVNIARHPELRRMIHELAAGFSLLHESRHSRVIEDVIPGMLKALGGSGADNVSLLYKVLYTAAVDAGTLSAAAAEDGIARGVNTWVRAGSSEGLVAGMKEAGANGTKTRQLLAEVGGERMAGTKGGESARQLQKILAENNGDSFLWKLLTSETGSRFAIDAIANAPFVLYAMYSEWQKGDMKDLSSAAFVIIDFVPMGMAVKKAGCEGVTAGTALMFAKEALYFTPAWPFVLVGDVLVMSWTVGGAIQLQNESEGLVDVLTYNGAFEKDGNNYRLKRLELPGGDTIARDQIYKWLFETKAVRVKHAIRGKEYWINNLSEKAFNVFNSHYLANDPALAQMRAAVQSHLDAINWEEASRYFMGGYLVWLGGFEYIAESDKGKPWAKLYQNLKDQVEKRKDVVLKEWMVPQLIALAEQKYATLNAESDLAPKLEELQKNLESLRGSPLGVNLVEKVREKATTLANVGDSAVFGETDTKEEKKLTSGQYWEKAYATYKSIYDKNVDIPDTIRNRTGFTRIRVIGFAWSGDMEQETRKSDQSRAGFASALSRITGDITRIKGAAPDPADSVDAKAFDFLASVVFPWRTALDESDTARAPEGSRYHEEYKDALEKVRALYSLNVDFGRRLKKGTEIVVSSVPLVIDEAADVELRFKDPSLAKEHQENPFAIRWSATPAGSFMPSEARGEKLRFAADKLPPAVLFATVERSGKDRLKGVVQKTVRVTMPDELLRVSMDPKKPWSGANVKFTVDIPERFYNTGTRFGWSVRNCTIRSQEAYSADVAAPMSGSASVEVKVLVETAGGALQAVASKTVEFEVEGGGGFAVNIDGEAQYVEGDSVLLAGAAVGMPSAARETLKLEWFLNGKRSAEGERFDLGRLKRGSYDVELRGAIRPADGEARTAAARRTIVVHDPAALLSVSVKGPASAMVNDEVSLRAEIRALAPAGERLKKDAWIEWAVRDVVYETGERLRMDTSRPGLYEFDVRAVVGEGLAPRVLARASHTLEIADSRQPPPSQEGGTEGPAKGDDKPPAGPGSKTGETPPPVKQPPKQEEAPTASPQEIASAYADGRMIGGEANSASSGGVYNWRYTLPSYVHNAILGLAFIRGFDDARGSKAAGSPVLKELQDAYIQLKGRAVKEFGAVQELYVISGDGNVEQWIANAYKDAYHWGSIAELEDAMKRIHTATYSHDASGALVMEKGPEVKRTPPDEPTTKICTHDPIIVKAWLKGWDDGYNKRTESAPTPADCGWMPVVNSSVTLRLLPDITQLSPGEIVKLQAVVSNARSEDHPLAFAWTGAGTSSEASAEFTAKAGGTFPVSVKVTGAKGRAVGEASVTFTVGELKVVVSGIPKQPVPVGTKVNLSAKVQQGGKAAPQEGLEFSWQPHPEVEFTGRAGAAMTVARFLRPQRTRMWVDVLRKEGGAMKTVVSSEPVEVEVTLPKLALECSPADPLVGEDVTVKLNVTPELPELDCRWELPANARQVGESKDSREVTFYPINTQPLGIKAMARLQHHGDELGEAKASVAARPYQVNVTGPRYPGPKPRVWSEQAKGLVEVESGTVVNQEVFFAVSINPQCTRAVRYEWGASPDGCSVYSPASRETRVNASQPGSYSLAVKVNDDRGIELGTGLGQLTVAPDPGKQVSSGAGAKLSQAQSAVAEGRLEEGISLAGEAAALDPRNAEAARLQSKWAGERQQVLQWVAQVNESLRKPDLVKAAASLDKARQIHPRYAPVKEAVAAYERAVAARNEKEKDRSRLITEGESLLKQDKLADAVGKFRQALAIRPDPAVQQRIAELTDLIARKDKARQIRAEGAALQDKNELGQAVAKYRESLGYWPDPALEKHISLLEQRMAAAQSGAKADALWKEGCSLYDAANYKGSIARFKESLSLKETAERRAYLDKLDAWLAAREDQVRQWVSKGAACEKRDDLPGAIANYKEALKLTPDDALAAKVKSLQRVLDARQAVDAVWSKPKPPAEARPATPGPSAPVTPTATAPRTEDKPSKPSSPPSSRTTSSPAKPTQPRAPVTPVQSKSPPPVQSVSTPSLNGTFSQTLSEGGQSMTVRCVIQQAGNNITADMSINAGEMSGSNRFTGFIRGNRVTLNPGKENEAQMTVSQDFNTLTMTIGEAEDAMTLNLRRER